MLRRQKPVTASLVRFGIVLADGCRASRVPVGLTRHGPACRDMGYLSRKMIMMVRRILPVPATPGRGLDASWRESAACLGADTELFFPVGSRGPAAEDIHAAKAFCGRCPVRVCCLTYALDTGQTAGIWGGYDENERRFMRQRQRRTAFMRDAVGGRRHDPRRG